jgi:predicted PurR-regulated permease PerM
MNLNLSLSAATRWGINFLIILGIIGALYWGRPIFIPTIISLLLAAMLWPAAIYLHEEGVPIPFFARRDGFPWLRGHIYRICVSWNLASIFLVVVLMSVALGIALGFGLAVPKMIQQLPNPNDDKDVQRVYTRFRDRVAGLSPVPLDNTNFPVNAKDSRMVQNILVALDPEKSSFIRDTLLLVGEYGRDWLVEWVLILFVLLFLLLEGRMLTRRVVEIFGPGLLVQTKVGEALKDMATQIRVYLVWRTIINFAMALFLGVMYYLLDLSQPWTWALLTAILWYVPYLGPILAGVPPVLDAFVSCESPWIAIGILFFYILFVTLEGYLVVPVVMGRSMELNATTVMLACMFWELVWGTSGLFLAMPLMAAFKTICEHVPDWKPWANLMSTRDDHEPPEDILGQKGSEDVLEDTQIMTASDAEALRGAREDTAMGRIER